jgi:phosphatidylglycerophosphate synthase
VARSLGVADTWGEAKNEFGDRIADAMLFIALGVAGYARPTLALAAMASIFGASYVGLLGKALGGKRVYGGIFGKGDRMIALALFTLYPATSGDLASYDLFLALTTVAALVTIAQRLKTIHDRA